MKTTVRNVALMGCTAALMGGITAVPAQAQASGPFIAMVYSTAEGALGGGTGATQAEAVASAMVGCRDVNRGTACTTIAVANADAGVPCLAVSVGDNRANYGVGSGQTTAEAESEALADAPGTQTFGSGCATPSAPAPDRGPGTATVTSDVDVYEIPDGVGTPYPGVFLRVGQQFKLVEPCRDNWCHLITPGIGDGTSWVYQDGFLNVE
ncbi:hypothetical protein PDG61_13485 [Mycolicibacterium sp. BiH015]|uniref:hypothetical protein n=1 Tax=Mycolicibacterium sp. BiH015 TaxID=3018808 RepID=UPI0022E63281|nr:hypothetical protein [Mycolicibacterium sp. BiH015]MDA2891931.1 hypothetical protein [Mycolicibacterium sp. BiH015]